MARPSLTDPALYLNRHLSWLAFNQRVLDEALDPATPLLERLRYLAITARNLDEFVSVHWAGVLRKIEDGRADPGLDGLTPSQERERIAESMTALVARQQRCWSEHLEPDLARASIRIVPRQQWLKPDREALGAFWRRELDPLLVPITVDPAHPFPRVPSRTLSLAFALRRRRAHFLGVLSLPRSLPSFIRIPGAGGDAYADSAQVVLAHASRLFRGYEIGACTVFRITRNSNLYPRGEDGANLLDVVRERIVRRHQGDAVRLEVDARGGEGLAEELRTHFNLAAWQLWYQPEFVDFARFDGLYRDLGRPELKFAPLAPPTPAPRFPLSTLRGRDILLHHPYDSYAPVLRFIAAAARDRRVVSIQQTLYRTNHRSSVVRALRIAAQRKKQVTVVVELNARFDEASNIRWARRLEAAGVQVVYGVVGLKAHAKLALLTRRDEDGALRHYAHVGSGNYNAHTARQYTDLSLLTANADVTAAIRRVFELFTAQTTLTDPGPLLVAPVNMASRWLELIEREREHARRGRPARIIAKMNALLDQHVIQALYRAARGGVRIDLLIRGMCALRPGVPGVSERIRVVSIVGRFLEHSRIVYFANGGAEEVYIGSADWMPRNLYERLEVALPVRDPHLRLRICDEILAAYLADAAKSHFLQPDGAYLRWRHLPADQRAPVEMELRPPFAAAPRPFCAQDWLIRHGRLRPEADTGTPPLASSLLAGAATSPRNAAKRAAAAKGGRR